jgi:hypothetical protein
MYEAVKLEFQIEWLSTLKKGLGVSGYGSVYPFASVTSFICLEEKTKDQKYTLQEFDDIACNYKTEIDFIISKTELNCSHSKTTYYLGDNKFTERKLGDKYTGGTLVVSGSVDGPGGRVGPVKVGTSVGAEGTIELDENNTVKDWSGTVKTRIEAEVGIKKGPLQAGASVGGGVDVELGPNGVSDVVLVGEVSAAVGIKAGPANLGSKIGIESRTSLNSGHSNLSGTINLNQITFSK